MLFPIYATNVDCKTKNDVIVMIKRNKNNSKKNPSKNTFLIHSHCFSKKFGQSYSSKGDKSVQTNCWKEIMSPAETYLELVI